MIGLKAEVQMRLPNAAFWILTGSAVVLVWFLVARLSIP
jgi:hypothetical protein